MTYRDTSQPETAAVLANPGPLIANLPAILGFYPQESLLMIGLDRLHPDSGRYALGPVLRVDLDDACAFTALLDMAAAPGTPLDCDLLFAVIVSGDLDRGDAVAGELFTASGNRDLPIAGCWYVPEILAGETYSMIFGPTAPSETDPWTAGQLPEIVAAVAMDPWHRAGSLPEPTRAEAVEKLSPGNRRLSGADTAFLQRLVGQLVDPILARPGHRDDHRLLSLAVDAGYAIGELDDAGDPAAITEAAEDDAELLAAVGVAVAHVRARDLALHTLVDAGTAAAPVLLAVARTFTGTVRANALCAYAVVQARRQLPMMAQHALMAAVEEFPDHVLTRCLLEASLIGRLAEITESAVAESRRIAERVASDCDGCDYGTISGWE